MIIQKKIHHSFCFFSSFKDHLNQHDPIKICSTDKLTNFKIFILNISECLCSFSACDLFVTTSSLSLDLELPTSYCYMICYNDFIINFI